MFIYYIYVCDIFYFYIIDKLLDKLNAIVLQNTAIIILNYLCIESYIYIMNTIIVNWLNMTLKRIIYIDYLFYRLFYRNY